MEVDIFIVATRSIQINWTFDRKVWRYNCDKTINEKYRRRTNMLFIILTYLRLKEAVSKLYNLVLN